MLLTDAQLEQIRQIIKDHHTAYIVNTVGKDAVTKAVLKDLQNKGLVNLKVNSIQDAYLYGQLLAMMDDPKFAKMSYAELRQHLTKNPVPLSSLEKQAVTMAQQKAAQYIVGLGNKVNMETGEVLIEADAKLRRALQTQIKDLTAENIERRETVQQLTSELGHMSGDWARNWSRIAITEKHTAMNTGIADHYNKRYGPDVHVARPPMPDACFTGGTPVLTSKGWLPIERVQLGMKVLTHKLKWRRVTHKFKTKYEGVLYGFNGEDPHVTANHPMLVGLNWKRADSVKGGDYLVGVSIGKPQNYPASSVQQTFFGDIAGSNSTPGMPVTAVKLYSYLQMRDSDIDVVFPYSILKDGVEMGEGFGELEGFGSSSRLVTLPGPSFSLKSLGAKRKYSSLASIISKSLTFFFGHSPQSSLLAHGLGRTGNTPIGEAFGNSASAYSEYGRKGLQRMLAGVEKFKNFIFGDMFPSVHNESIYPIVESVNSVVTGVFDGWVYNLEVEDHESYVANGRIVHNCKHCKRLHLGPDGQPRIFKLSTLMKNGATNFGRKAADWKAVTGSVHPHCQCQMVRIPVGWGFNEFGSLVPGGEYGVVYQDEEEMVRAMLRENDLIKAMTGESKLTFQGLPIVIETPAGGQRHWKEPQSGESGSTDMLYAYGYIEGTMGNDDDEIDVFIGPAPDSEAVFIIHQQNPRTGTYDEDKVMLGFMNEEQARVAYMQHYDRPDYYISCMPVRMDQFKRMIAGTAPDTGEMLKSGTQFQRLVIPLQKAELKVSGNITPTAVTGPAAYRAPGPGTMANFYIGLTPKKADTGLTDGLRGEMRDTVTAYQEDHEPVDSKRGEWGVLSPWPKRTYEVNLPEDFEPMADPGDADINRGWIEGAVARGSMVNRADPTNEGDDKDG